MSGLQQQPSILRLMIEVCLVPEARVTLRRSRIRVARYTSCLQIGSFSYPDGVQ